MELSVTVVVIFITSSARCGVVSIIQTTAFIILT
eukprot:CAMPEP_0197538134 /NCGR_PEP_ID=MMETSP1318-20131121/58917_1 /TAXON_ID=552666 /ORGANISM="Partenskyella glossopodia, Strain RCC365" /LENGTH=33 /DNA_ID= /DNA_START= /DNA_END= /DNA_ORIENTATION=